MKKPRVLVIVGPTASGKSDLAVSLSKTFNGEVISADSRQVYKGLNIGTGKITKREMQRIPHHLLDVVNPDKQFSVSDFKSMANESISQIIGKGKLPIIVGGTGFYIDAITDRTNFPEVPANPTLRKTLENKSVQELFELLKGTDSARATTIDPQNKVRLIRALEIVEALGKVPPISYKPKAISYVYIGLRPDNLDERIYKRLTPRIPGILRETKKLTFKRAYELGLEYRYAALYLKKKLDKNEFIEQLNTAIRQYSKRQMTYFKRNKKIKWFEPDEYSEIEKYVRIALKKGLSRSSLKTLRG
jgi:tRNA dimethylallyltransferase